MEISHLHAERLALRADLDIVQAALLALEAAVVASVVVLGHGGHPGVRGRLGAGAVRQEVVTVVFVAQADGRVLVADTAEAVLAGHTAVVAGAVPGGGEGDIGLGHPLVWQNGVGAKLLNPNINCKIDPFRIEEDTL